MIRIKSKRHLFRRCGVAHPKGPVEYPDGRFSEDELEILKAEPMLNVEVICEEDNRPEGIDSDTFSSAVMHEGDNIPDLTVADMKRLLDKAGIEYSPKAKKADLQELINQQKSKEE
jgi:hypothetical protein